jgi:hypothetical protein
MRRLVRAGVGAGILTGVGAAALKVRGRRAARLQRAAEERRNLWPPVPVKPGTEAHIDADRVDAERS